MTSRTVLCTLDDLEQGVARRFNLGAAPVVVVRIGDDVHVLADRCSHGDVALSGGDVDCATRRIECPRHGSSFDLVTGAALSLPATRPVTVYRVRVDDGRVWIETPAGGAEDHRGGDGRAQAGSAPQ